MARVNYIRKRARAHSLITKWGTRGYLRKADGTQRNCTVLEVALTPTERTRLPADVDAVHLISPIGLSSKPDHDKETLIILHPETLEELGSYRLVTPAVPLSPGGVVIYWECNTKGKTRAV